MNETIRLLAERKSVRVFENREIAPEVKDAILAAAMRAPTAGNMMLYSILDITDQSIKDRLAVTCDDQPFIATAKMVLIFCADYRRWHRKFRLAGCDGGDVPAPELSDLLLAASDAVIAAHAACTAAESLGVGSCYIGDIIENFEEHRALLKLPPQTAPVCMLVFGYPTAQQRERRQTTRFPRESIVFENGYRELTEDELLEMMPNERTQALYTRKYISAFAREMVRSTKEIFKNWNRKD